MSTQGLESRRRGLSGGLRDLVRPDALRCINPALECHHVITTAAARRITASTCALRATEQRRLTVRLPASRRRLFQKP